MGVVVQASRRFVYGTFQHPGKERGGLAALAWQPFVPDPDYVAIEVIREYSPSELLGKIYIHSLGGGWVPADPARVRERSWYQTFHQMSPDARRTPKAFRFEMAGSGAWRVLHFRDESDESGTYVAVALQYAS
jgi:hypothetical protein